MKKNDENAEQVVSAALAGFFIFGLLSLGAGLVLLSVSKAIGVGILGALFGFYLCSWLEFRKIQRKLGVKLEECKQEARETSRAVKRHAMSNGEGRVNGH